jgi:hypothetical protein
MQCKCNLYDSLYQLGLYQITGHNLYFYDLTEKTVFEYLFDEEEQEKVFENL